MDRRRFLQACGVLAGGAAAGGTLQAIFRVVPIGPPLHRTTVKRVAMGTFVSMTALDDARLRGAEAIGEAFEEIHRLERIFSRYDASSPVAALNRDGFLPSPPPELRAVLGEALRLYPETGGAFDVTVKPIVDLFRSTGGRFPPALLEEAMRCVDARKVGLDSAGARFCVEGMGITLDGIAKGYIVDRAADALRRAGVRSCLVEAGGDIRVWGDHTWRIAVRNPKGRGNHPAVLRLRNGAVATSGSYEIYYDPDRRFHHLIDPRSGRSANEAVSATVCAPSAMEADALATAAFVLGTDAGLRLLDSRPGNGGLVIDREGLRFRSARWRVPA